MSETVTLSVVASGDGQTVYSVANLHPNELAGHLVVVPEAALSDRRTRHGLASDAAALEYIVGEHYARLHGSLPEGGLVVES